MVSKKILALAALSLVTASSAATAQSARPLSLANASEVQRAGAEMRGESDFLRRSGWILGILALGILVFVVVEANRGPPASQQPLGLHLRRQNEGAGGATGKCARARP